MKRRLPLLLALLLLSASGASAQVVQRANLVDLCENAAVVIAGQVVRIDEGVDPKLKMPVRRITLSVREVLKADDPRQAAVRVRQSRTYTFTQCADPALLASDARPPEYRPGEDVLLFLAPTSRLGLTSPIAMSHGKFAVRGLGRGKGAVVVNRFNNRNLTVNEPGKPTAQAAAAAQLRRARGAGLSQWEQAVLTRTTSGPLDYARFSRLVRKLSQRRGGRGGR